MDAMYEPTEADQNEASAHFAHVPTDDEMDAMAREEEAFGTALAFLGEPDRELAPDVADDLTDDEINTNYLSRRPSAERGE